MAPIPASLLRSDLVTVTGFALLLLGCILAWADRPEPQNEFRWLAERFPLICDFFHVIALLEYACYGRWLRQPCPLILGVLGAALMALSAELSLRNVHTGKRSGTNVLPFVVGRFPLPDYRS
jgi:hypothetical protein